MRRIGAACLVLWTATVCAATPGKSSDSPGRSIYTCIDAQGHRLSSDRPIPECLAQEQRMLNRDGSPKGVLPPAQSPEEKARAENAKRQAEQQRLAREAEARRDRALVARYPDLVAHDTARSRAQEPVTKQIEAARRRLAELEVENQALQREREAIPGKVLPQALKARVAANEGSIEAQNTILRDQEAERERLNQQFDAELARLRALWSGAALGRTGTTPTPSSGPARNPSAP
ncbi:MAG TPA: hypothetical protein VFY73_27000 [Ideonella sp.]|uniref:hypothetical protein n=1 Tax=Ideonella sp. TaxID=1929293 RepID=UPI002E314354|nr:hypothetical protein [Ideonella sp.]HEX5687679.1 hypothetical protein [Ideonella sp.]